MTIAVYPGSFDPITNGHLDIVKRASSLFESLIVAVYDRPEKNLLFSVEERVELAQKACEDIPNVQVRSFTGLVVDFIHQMKADVMIRGLRANSDFEREFEMALMNRTLAPDIELVCLMTSPRYQFISSSGGGTEQWLTGLRKIASAAVHANLSARTLRSAKEMRPTS